MLEKGKKVGEYILLEKLGAGGFGEVWKAEKRTELSVSYFALKFFHPKDGNLINLEIVKREVQTWQSLSGLQNVISVIEANKFEDYVYIVSEYASGGSLDKWLKQRGGKAGSHEEAVAITRQILQGLEGMHGEGFVHRDLKPANVLLKRNVFYLADFGITRQMKTHSKTNSTAGTYEFMPPEAFENNPSVTPQTDIWAVGAILQVLLTGQLPFPQDNIASLIAAILMSEPEPLPENVPFALRQIVNKSLQKKRENRFQSAREMREALRNSLTSQKFVENQTFSQSETVAFENNDKTEKFKVVPTKLLQVGQKLKKNQEPKVKSKWSIFLWIPVVGGGFIIVFLLIIWVSSWKTPDAPANANINPQVVKELDTPPLSRQISQPSNTIYFKNTKENLKGDLTKNFLGFSLYYPQSWTKSPSDTNFLDISKRASNGVPIEQMVVTPYQSRGTMMLDQPNFPKIVEKSNQDLKKSLGDSYQVVIQGETMIQNGRWKAYEVKFQSSGKNEKGEKVTVWGKRLWIPLQNAGTQNGFVITMLASSLSDTVKSVDDVGVQGDLANVLETFEPSSNY